MNSRYIDRILDNNANDNFMNCNQKTPPKMALNGEQTRVVVETSKTKNCSKLHPNDIAHSVAHSDPENLTH